MTTGVDLIFLQYREKCSETDVPWCRVIFTMRKLETVIPSLKPRHRGTLKSCLWNSVSKQHGMLYVILGSHIHYAWTFPTIYAHETFSFFNSLELRLILPNFTLGQTILTSFWQTITFFLSSYNQVSYTKMIIRVSTITPCF